jgi:ADP-ribose pyrophosphatase
LLQLIILDSGDENSDGNQMEEIKYQGKFIKVSEIQLDEHTWEKVYLPNGVMIFPLNEKGEILIIEEKRPHEKTPTRLKFVSGHLEDGEEVLETANRELQEEVGFKASELRIFHEHHSSGTVNNSLYFVLAKGLTPSKLPNPDGEDTILDIQYHSLEKIKLMLFSEQIPFNFPALGIFKLDYLINNNCLY